jgi:4,5-dihydroxyphthalate decarboxylase
MSELSLSLACWDYDRLKALADGRVKPAGIELNYLSMPVEEIFYRLTTYQEFDVSEMSLSTYLIAKEKGILDYTAIPVFPSRFFRHSCIFVNKNSKIVRPEDLKGKKMGVPEYQMTASLWIRGFLEHDYGVKAKDMTWYCGGLEETGREEKIKLNLPDEISIQAIPADKTLNSMLENGEIDALMTARTPSAFLKKCSNIDRLFPDYYETEKDYYKRTGFFPIMHLVVIKNEILKQYPWVAANLLKAFELSKRFVYDSYNETGALKTTFPWQVHAFEELKSLMGKDYWPYGIETNRSTIETAIQYSFEQGLTKRKLTIEELFAPTTFSQFKI